jgi:hypothetical protein
MNMTKKLGTITGRFAAVIQILALTLLASCTAAGVGASANVCHATGNAANPYEVVTINSAALLDEHRTHLNDIFPVPEGGCPQTLVVVDNGKITICHATGVAAAPYNEIKVSVNGLNGHNKHQNDIIPAPENGCPATALVTATVVITEVVSTDVAGTDVVSTEVVSADMVIVCHATADAANPYEQANVAVADLDAYLVANPNDINPMPLTGCPLYLVVVDNGEVTFCHVNGNQTDPYDEITVKVNGLDGHGLHEGDVFPIADGAGCPATLVSVDKIMICHATGSVKNPYVLITVDINGLNGHNQHAGDIIPAPAAGCPVTRP